MYYMATVTVRLTDKEKNEILKYGTLSEGLREGARLYVKAKKKREILGRLEKLQKRNPVTISSSEIVRMLRADRGR